MNITWHGQTCFKILSQKRKNGAISILIDPFGKETGLRSPRIEADILLFRENEKKKLPGQHFSITGPGEYDLKDTYIRGISAFTKDKKDKAMIYAINTEDISICHLGLFGQEELGPEQLEAIGNVDILMIPIGGGEALDASQASKIMSQIEPKIIIPMYYKIPKLKAKLDGLDKFLKLLGIKSPEVQSKLTIKARDISEGEVKIIVLQA